MKGEISFVKQLHKWMGEKCKWNLCYRASRDGWNAQDFHSHCNNKGPTVVLVKANDCIFGGYTDQHWDSGNDDNQRFIYYLVFEDIVYKCKNADELGKRFPGKPVLEIVQKILKISRKYTKPDSTGVSFGEMQRISGNLGFQRKHSTLPFIEISYSYGKRSEQEGGGGGLAIASK